MFKKLISVIASLFLFISILFMAFWLSLSEEKLLAWSQFHLQKQLINQMSPIIEGVHTRFWGLEVESIELKDKNNHESLLKVTDLKIRFNLISLLLKQELPFMFQSYGGTGDGAVEFWPEIRIKLNASNIVLNWIPVVQGSQIIKSNPKLSFEGEFSPDANEGSVRLNMKGLSLNGKKEHTTLSVNLPDTNLKNITADLVFDAKQLNLNVQTTGDISARIKGKIIGNWKRIRRSKVDLELYADMLPQYQAKLGLFNNILNSYRASSGKISIRLSGNLMLPRIKKI